MVCRSFSYAVCKFEAGSCIKVRNNCIYGTESRHGIKFKTVFLTGTKVKVTCAEICPAFFFADSRVKVVNLALLFKRVINNHKLL